ncbi:MAG: NUDIX domain-containing protein [Lactobacillus sp.]|jgi:ADP-ribose pyrophosphatase YjhB (NUDIX family)|nr:NUDIX domain-containing protein [Lactobacillus sp.]
MTQGAFGIIQNTDKEVLLVLRRDYPLWDLPGGTLKTGELPAECVCREIREETGLAVVVKYLVGTYVRRRHKDRQYIFSVTNQGRPMTFDNSETKKIAYFAIDQLPKNMVPLRSHQIKDASFGLRHIHQTQKENWGLFQFERLLRWAVNCFR